MTITQDILNLLTVHSIFAILNHCMATRVCALMSLLIDRSLFFYLKLHMS